MRPPNFMGLRRKFAVLLPGFTMPESGAAVERATAGAAARRLGPAAGRVVSHASGFPARALAAWLG